MFNVIVEHFEMGGFVMLPILFVSIVLWYALVYRFMHVVSNKRDPRTMFKKVSKGKLKSNSVLSEATIEAYKISQSVSSPLKKKQLMNEYFFGVKASLSKYRMLVRSLVAIAPLLGLLGTVDGMIETFDSLGDMALFSASGGIAGGISKALFTTQMGLAISIPGLLMGTLIEKKERAISRELDQMRDLICANKQ